MVATVRIFIRCRVPNTRIQPSCRSILPSIPSAAPASAVSQLQPIYSAFRSHGSRALVGWYTYPDRCAHDICTGWMAAVLMLVLAKPSVYQICARFQRKSLSPHTGRLQCEFQKNLNASALERRSSRGREETKQFRFSSSLFFPMPVRVLCIPNWYTGRDPHALEMRYNDDLEGRHFEVIIVAEDILSERLDVLFPKRIWQQNGL